MTFLINNSFRLFLFFLSFVLIIRTLQANIAEYDDYWKERQLQAIKNLNNAYHPNPEKVTQHFNDHLVRALIELNSSRRKLKGKKGLRNSGPCEATNPIDKCWRCDPDWEKNRKKMADCALGFAQGTTGGKSGEIYEVTNDGDDPCTPVKGTLRHAVIQKDPLWIIFPKDMVIELKEELMICNNKTIDGRGANVHIAGRAGLTVQFTSNVIISNLHIHDIKTCEGGNVRDSVDHMGFRTKSDGDGVSLFGATNVWLDHLSIYRCGDGIIDVVQGSTAVTISNCHFTDHNDVMLFGASDNTDLDEKMQITVAFNHFGKGLVQRMPRVRFGFIHVVNNDYTHWIMYAIGGSMKPTIISQGNRFVASDFTATKEVTHRDCPEENWRNWDWTSTGDVFLNDAYFTPSGDPNFSSKFGADKLIPFQPGEMVKELTSHSGTLDCEPGRPC